jgi:pimeloyl-ACP methyl ester carboxylesterase
MHYTVQGEGPPVVLIHGFLDSHRTWRRNIETLAENHRIYALDGLGFGSSDRARAPIYTVKRQTRLLREFFETLRIGRASIVGHSMGGAVGLQFAYDFPNLVHKLVLIAPATYLYASFPRYGINPLPRRVSRGMLGLYEKFQGDRNNQVRMAYGDPSRITDDAIVFRSQMMRVRGAHDALVSMTKSKPDADVHHHMSNVNVPVLIVWGKRDRVLPAAHAARHYRDLPNARLEWIDSAGHLPHEEEPEAVNRLVQEFLDAE